jgi:hypothetical protein
VMKADCNNLRVGPFFVEAISFDPNFSLNEPKQKFKGKDKPKPIQNGMNAKLSADLCLLLNTKKHGPEAEIKLRGIFGELEKSINAYIRTVEFEGEKGKESFDCPPAGSRVMLRKLKFKEDDVTNKTKGTWVAAINFELLAKEKCDHINWALYEITQSITLDKKLGRIVFGKRTINITSRLAEPDTWAAHALARSKENREMLIGKIRDPLERLIVKFDNKPMETAFLNYGLQVKNLKIGIVDDYAETDITILSAVPVARIHSAAEWIIRALEGKNQLD